MNYYLLRSTGCLTFIAGWMISARIAGAKGEHHQQSGIIFYVDNLQKACYNNKRYAYTIGKCAFRPAGAPFPAGEAALTGGDIL